VNKKPAGFFNPAWIVLSTLWIPIAFIIHLAIRRFITSIVGDFIYVDGVRRITEDY
jgi:hypothetical protein